MSGSLSFEQASALGGSAAQPSPAPPAAATPVGDGGNAGGLSFEQAAALGQPSPAAAAPQPATKTGMAANIAAGVAEAGEAGLNILSDPFGNIIGKPAAALLTTAHDVIGPYFGAKPFTPEARAAMMADTVPQIGTRVGSAVADAVGAPDVDKVVPGDGEQALVRTGISGALTGAMLGGSNLAGAAMNALGGASGNVAGEVASNIVPPEWAPAAGAIAGVLGGAAVPAVAGTAGALLGNRITRPLTQAGRERNVGDQLYRAASDPAAALQSLDDATVAPGMGAPAAELVPGSRPTVYQLTGDAGLGSVENAARVADKASFRAQDDGNNAARTSFLQAQGNDIATPDAAAGYFRSALGDLDQAATAQRAADLRTATGAAEALPGNLPTAPGQAETGLETIGGRLRQGLDGQSQSAKQAASSLFEAVDPDGTLRVDMSPVADAAKAIQQQRTPMSAPISANEQAIYDAARGYGSVQPFSFLKDFRSWITDTQRQAKMTGDGQAVRRLSTLLDGVDNTLAGRVAQRAADDQSAVAAGRMSAEDTMNARMAAQRDAWYGDRANAARLQQDAQATNGGGGVRPDATGRPGGVSPIPRGQEPTGRGLGGPASDPGLSQEPVAANFSAANADQYAQARTAWRDWNQRFMDSPGVGNVLARDAGGFKLDNSQVPGQLFRGGPGAAERIRAYMDAGGNMPALADAAAFRLRQAATNPDGTIDPVRYGRWAAQHGEAMNSLPQLSSAFGDAARATEALEAHATAHRQARQDFERSPAGEFLGDRDPVAAIGRIVGRDTAAADIHGLAQRTSRNPAARAALQNALIEHITSKLTGTKPAGETGTNYLNSASFQKFVQAKASALTPLLGAERVANLRRIAADLNRASKDTSVAGSNTSHNNADAAQHGSAKHSLLSQVILGEALGKVGAHFAGVLGHLGVPAMLVLNAMRASGITKQHELLGEAIRNPELARNLLRLASGRAQVSQARQVAMQIMRTSAVPLSTSHTPEVKPRNRLSAYGLATPPTVRPYVGTSQRQSFR